MPNWLLIAQAAVDMLWKGAAIVLTVFLVKDILPSLKGWWEIKTAQLSAERAIERQRREAAEHSEAARAQDVALAKTTVETLREETEAVHRMREVDAVKHQSELGRIQQRLGGAQSAALNPTSLAFDSLLSLEMLQGYSITVSMFLGKWFDDLTRDGAISLTLDEIGMVRGLLSPERLKAAVDDLREVTVEIAKLTGQEPEKVLVALAADVKLEAGPRMGVLKTAAEMGFPVPTARRYLLGGESSEPEPTD